MQTKKFTDRVLVKKRRPSQQKTVVSAVRQVTGLSAEDFGEMIGKKLGTIKKLESGHLQLSEETALRISEETGVLARWLLEGDATKPMKLEPKWGERYVFNREIFQIVRSMIEDPIRRRLVRNYEDKDAWSLEMCSEWFGILAAARKEDRGPVAEYRLGEFIRLMKKEFGFDPAKKRKIA